MGNRKSNGATKYYLSRQKYWGVEPEDGTVCEISIGGSNYANPDQLCAKWPELGEGKTFDDPREAVSAAIAVRDAWIAAGEKNAKVAKGCTGGFTLPFEAETDDDLLHAWAEQTYEKLPKCRECANVLPEHPYGNEFTVMFENEYPFCSEYCAERDEIAQYRANEEFNDTQEQPEKF